MKMKNLLIIALASVVMFGCSGGGGWPKEQMDLCVSQGSIDFGADIATCICSELEKTYPNYTEVEAMFSSATPNMEELQKVLTIFINCGASFPQ
mgnify:CR=1 FL=1|tara:strand:+ start:127 stop:408 length:282 start_codon:yes stop_codon:yes gene_type:complete